ncbi:ABC transporter substrate-binding protein [Phytomonospora sp. NPDC050363]|uniref:ABC transporter substrate-binding protein n=1 Tax=Phytomonospora sp. NPDC050363 TaxID=3155642 RepID=UPI0033FB5F8A
MGLRRRGFVALAMAAALVALPACSKDADDGGGGDNTKVEVFSWWTGPGEEEGLAAMIADFKTKNPDIEFVNAAVSGGAGSNAKAILQTRLKDGDAPDSYQRHAGLELQDDIRNGWVSDITSLYDSEGWRDVFPAELLEYLTIDGKLYAVPVNIHRSNLMWFNPKTLKDLGIDEKVPATWSEFLTVAEKIKGEGKIPLAIGPGWTQKHLLENVLLGELGKAGYDGLWNGTTDWTGPEVTEALGVFAKVLEYSDIKSPSADWQPMMDKVVSGDAAFAVMGDWADAYLKGDKGLAVDTDYKVAASPGTDNIFNFLSDSFTLPAKAKNKTAAEAWLKEAGSKSGQDAFNPKKGSVPARTDGDAALYTGYLKWGLEQWQGTKDGSVQLVGSLAHGVVANNAWNAEIDTALGLFIEDGDVAKFAAAVKQKYEETK